MTHPNPHKDLINHANMGDINPHVDVATTPITGAIYLHHSFIELKKSQSI
jgi:hypothetical protein